MANPFSVRWLAGWTFQTVLMEGNVQVEAHGFGICLRTPLRHGESPVAAADRLVHAEDQRRRALHNAWRRGEPLSGAASAADSRVPLVGELLPLEAEIDLEPPALLPLIRLAA
jgi:hypothetical protein